MRLKGTGKDPEHRYPEGLIFDAPPVQAKPLVDEGYAEVLDPQDDPARTDSQVAAAVQRGDNLSNPADAEAAEGISEQEALATVQGGPVDEPVDGGVVRKAPLGDPEPGLPGEAPASSTDQGEAPAAKAPTPKQRAVIAAEELGVEVGESDTEAEIRANIDEYLEDLKVPAEPGDGEGSGDGDGDQGGSGDQS